MRPGCCGPKRHGDMHANFSVLLQPYRPPSAAGPSTQEKHCCWERMVLCSAPTDCSPVRGGMPGSPAAAGFPAGMCWGTPWLRDGRRLLPLGPAGGTNPGGKCWGNIPGAVAEAVPLDCSFANTQGEVHKNAPSRSCKALGSCSSRFPRGVFPGQQRIHRPPRRKH